MEVLNRNFQTFNSVDNYLVVLKNKIIKLKINCNIQNVELLFNELKRISIENITEYNRIMSKLQKYTEEFVIQNALYIREMLLISEEQRKIILLKLNNLSYNDDLDIIEMLEKMNESFNNIIYKLVDEILVTIVNDKEIMHDLAESLKDREDKKFIATVMDKFLEQYSEISQYSFFIKLFYDKYLSIGDIAYNYVIDKIKQDDKNKNEEYYIYNAMIRKNETMKKMKKEQYYTKKRLQ